MPDDETKVKHPETLSLRLILITYCKARLAFGDEAAGSDGSRLVTDPNSVFNRLFRLVTGLWLVPITAKRLFSGKIGAGEADIEVGGTG